MQSAARIDIGDLNSDEIDRSTYSNAAVQKGPSALTKKAFMYSKASKDYAN